MAYSLFAMAVRSIYHLFLQTCLIVYSRLLLEVHVYAMFNQVCLLIYSRLLLEVRAMFSSGMYYSLIDIAIRSVCNFRRQECLTVYSTQMFEGQCNVFTRNVL